MKFLLDVNTPRALGRRLLAEGHACRHAADVGLGRAPDDAIVQEARANGEVILTHDLDYGHLLAFSGHATPSVVIFRLRHTHPSVLHRRLVERWQEIEPALARGAIVSIEDAVLRIRPLPIVRSD